jgi:hypothetical protein
MARLMKSWPKMEGASDSERRLKIVGRLESWLIVRISESVRGVWAMPPPIFEERRLILLAKMRDLIAVNKVQKKRVDDDGAHLKAPPEPPPTLR